MRGQVGTLPNFCIWRKAAKRTSTTACPVSGSLRKRLHMQHLLNRTRMTAKSAPAQRSTPISHRVGTLSRNQDPRRTRHACTCKSVVSFQDNQRSPIREMPLGGEIAVLSRITFQETVIIGSCKSRLDLRFPELEAICSVYPVRPLADVSHDKGRTCL